MRKQEGVVTYCILSRLPFASAWSRLEVFWKTVGVKQKKVLTARFLGVTLAKIELARLLDSEHAHS